ncbi:MAG: FkbM family methyltransferase [Prevotellaceae bacterium]|jgi:FkbM family methyltransferase|nr:FkbM family methyltransferase [Prevotellaceae bacterium]
MTLSVNQKMKNPAIKPQHRYWTYFVYFLKRIARFVKIPASVSSAVYQFMASSVQGKKLKTYKDLWLVEKDGEKYFDINGAKIPDVSLDAVTLVPVFEDVFTIPYFYEDNYEKSVVEYVDQYLMEGPYGYTGDDIDVTVKKGDVVIDVGAWIGDFSAYAANKGATVYAFEPVNETFQWLRKTKMLNNSNRGGIFPVQKGLSNKEMHVDITINNKNSAANSIIITDSSHNSSETITLTTIDRFAEENKLERIDFIKADIEGAERDMLRGASNVLKTFAPKLAICTYHLPDDPEVLERIIVEANPDYKVVHLRHKLFAAVITNKYS